MPCGNAKEMNVILPMEGYPSSDRAMREWFRRTHGREPSDVEIGEILNALAKRQSQQIQVRDWPHRRGHVSHSASQPIEVTTIPTPGTTSQ